MSRVDLTAGDVLRGDPAVLLLGRAEPREIPVRREPPRRRSAPTGDLLARVRREIAARRAELAPAVRETAVLERVLRALNDQND